MSIAFRQVEHTYNPGTPFAYAALKGIDLEIEEGKVTAVIGETGSGKCIAAADKWRNRGLREINQI